MLQIHSFKMYVLTNIVLPFPFTFENFVEGVHTNKEVNAANCWESWWNQKEETHLKDLYEWHDHADSHEDDEQQKFVMISLEKIKI